MLHPQCALLLCSKFRKQAPLSSPPHSSVTECRTASSSKAPRSSIPYPLITSGDHKGSVLHCAYLSGWRQTWLNASRNHLSVGKERFCHWNFTPVFNVFFFPHWESKQLTSTTNAQPKPTDLLFPCFCLSCSHSYHQFSNPVARNSIMSMRYQVFTRNYVKLIHWFRHDWLEDHILPKVKLFSRVSLFVTSWTVAHQAPPSMGFSRKKYWSGSPFPSLGDLPYPGIEPGSPAL